MKTSLITIIALLSSTLALHATNIEDHDLSLIKNEVMTLSLEKEEQKTLIKSIRYNEVEDCLAMEFEDKLEVIHLFNEQGEVEMFFPVSSNKVNLGLSLFESGQYKMGFTIEGMNGIQFADISVK